MASNVFLTPVQQQCVPRVSFAVAVSACLHVRLSAVHSSTYASMAPVWQMSVGVSAAKTMRPALMVNVWLTRVRIYFVLAPMNIARMVPVSVMHALMWSAPQARSASCSTARLNVI